MNDTNNQLVKFYNRNNKRRTNIQPLDKIDKFEGYNKLQQRHNSK